ncbi:MAG TPA: site-specific integrase [Candidatus Binatia bacterium]|nr:site-specific integrase [Candidatus Binatia bacterium]
MRTAADEFLQKGLTHRSAGTRRAYARPLDVLVNVTGERMPITRLDRTHIDEALRLSKGGIALKVPASRRQELHGRSEESLNVDRTAYSRFVHYWQTRGYFHGKISPTAHIEYAKRKRKSGERKRPLTIEVGMEVMRLAGETHPRDRMAVALALFTGMRVSEIAALRWGHVKWADKEIHFPRDKADDEHVAMFNPPLERELQTWHGIYGERHGTISDDWYVVPGRLQGKYRDRFDRMNPDWPMIPNRPATNLYVCLKPLLVAAGVQHLDGKAWHTLRRTFANEFYEEKRDIRSVQEALGHKSEKTTEIYLDMDEQRNKNKIAMRNWDPTRKIAQATGNVVPFQRKAQ